MSQTLLQPLFNDILRQEKEWIGKTLTIGGWARSVRSAEKGELLFIQLTDGSCQKDLQVIVRKSDKHANFDEIATGNVGWSFKISGTFIESPLSDQEKEQGKHREQLIELVASQVDILGKTTSEKPYPLQKRGAAERKKGIPIERYREVPHLKGRTYLFSAIFKIRDVLAKATHDFFHDLKCTWVSAPLITFSDCEGAGEAFVVTTDEEISMLCERSARRATGKVEQQIDDAKPFFGKKAFLTVSGQLEGEAVACGMTRIYTFGPTFRAEKSNTTRHLAEFWMVEPELSFIEFNDLMSVAEKYVQYCIQQALDECQSELDVLIKAFGVTSIEALKQYAVQPFVRITYTQAVDILQSAGFPVNWGDDLCSDYEKHLTDVVYKHPIIVREYPTSLKAFYMKPTQEGKTVESFDLLVPTVGELIGGSMREDDYETLKAKMLGLKMDIEPYKEYLELREFGTVPHGGFGLGFERLIKFVGGIPNIRDTIFFPRAY
jgi:asparaginyl-tRNA synthetase